MPLTVACQRVYWEIAPNTGRQIARRRARRFALFPRILVVDAGAIYVDADGSLRNAVIRQVIG